MLLSVCNPSLCHLLPFHPVLCRVVTIKDFKLPGKYNKQAGNQTARDFFQFYISSIFQ